MNRHMMYLALSLALVSASAMGADSKPAANAKPAATRNVANEQPETVIVIIKDLLGFDGDLTIKPEGGGKALFITSASNNKTFTTAKMMKIQAANENKTPIKFLVKGDQIVDVLD